MVNRGWLGSSGYLMFYYLNDKGKRVNVFRLFEPFGSFLSESLNDDGDAEIFRAGAKHVLAGLGSWEKMKRSDSDTSWWFRPVIDPD